MWSRCLDVFEAFSDQVAATNCDLGGLKVTQLTHHNDVRITSKDASQAPGKGQPALRLDCNLNHTVETVLAIPRRAAAMVRVRRAEDASPARHRPVAASA